MTFPEEVVGDALARLRRVEGQVRGIHRMIEEGRECRDVVTQLSAAARAIDRTRTRLLASGLRYCSENPAEAEAAGMTLDEFERLLIGAR